MMIVRCKMRKKHANFLDFMIITSEMNRKALWQWQWCDNVIIAIRSNNLIAMRYFI